MMENSQKKKKANNSNLIKNKNKSKIKKKRKSKRKELNKLRISNLKLTLLIYWIQEMTSNKRT